MFLSHIVFIYLFIYLVIQVVYDAHMVLAMSLAIIQKLVGAPQKFISVSALTIPKVIVTLNFVP